MRGGRAGGEEGDSRLRGVERLGVVTDVLRREEDPERETIEEVPCTQEPCDRADRESSAFCRT